MKQAKATGFKRLMNATLFSLEGLKTAWQDEEAFRLEVWLLLILTPLAFLVSGDTVERILLIMPIFLLMAVETLNSAIENAIDRISDERHLLSKKAKDLGSAAVFIIYIMLKLIWISIIWQNFFAKTL